MSLEKSGLTEPKQLKGKTIGTTGVPSDEAFLNGVLMREGVKKDDYKLVNLGFSLAQALKSGNVDAVVGAYYPWEGIKMNQEGFPVKTIQFQKYGVPDYYELVIIARDEMIAKDSPLIRGFMRALTRGQVYVTQHPDRAVEILHKASPDLQPAFLQASLDMMLPLMGGTNDPFAQDAKVWVDMLEFMKTSGLIKRPPDPASVFTNGFLH